MEAGSCDGVGLGSLVEFVVDDDPKVLGVSGGGWCGSYFSRPPGGVPL